MPIAQSFELSKIPTKGEDVENGQTTYSTRDEAEMAHLGRYQVLRVRSLIWSIVDTQHANIFQGMGDDSNQGLQKSDES